MLRTLLACVREWLLRLVGSLSPRRGDDDLRRELEYHLELAEKDLLARGYSPKEATRLARARHGQSVNALEQLRSQRSIPWFGAFTLDMRLGLRMLRKYPGLTLIGGLAMMVGFAILTTVFAYFDTVIWNSSVPLEHGDDLVAVQLWDPEESRRSETTLADFERWRDRMHTLVDVGAFRTVRHEAEFPDGWIGQVDVAEMSAAGFRAARVDPQLGRTFVESDEGAEAEAVIVIGHDEWNTRFAGSTAVLGQSIRIGETLHTIIGVMPEAFGFPINHQYWIPLRAGPAAPLPAPPAGAVYARLRSGATIETAQAELSSIGLLPDAADAQRDQPLRPTIISYADNFISDIDPRDLARRTWNARLVMLFVSLLLIPPCANIAMLIYARTVMRQEEIAIRTALGASRRRIVAQLFIEMLVLTAIAASLALVAVSFLLSVFEQNMLQNLERLPFWIDFDLSLDTVAFAATLALLSAIATGLLPALKSTANFARPGLSALDPRNRIRLGALWTTLAVAQIAFSFAALPTAVELAWGTLRPQALGPGFAAGDYLTVRLNMDLEPTDEAAQPETARERFQLARGALIDSLERDPRVGSKVAELTLLPGQGGRGAWHRVMVEIPDAGVPQVGGPAIEIGAPLGRRVDIDESYFETLESTLLAGRYFDASEYRDDSRSVIVNGAFTQEFFAEENPLGRRVRYLYSPQLQGTDAPLDETWYEIVGVAEDRPAHAEGPTVFHPADPGGPPARYLLLRSGPEVASLRAQLPELASGIDPLLEVADIRTLEELYAEQAFGNYVGGFSLIVGSLAVLLLSAAGLYALMSFTVNQRQREIGIRLALGARPRRLLAGVFRTALWQTTIGAVLGLLIALLIEYYIPARRLGGWDLPGILPSAAALMIIVGLAAAWGPARRTLAVSPSITLKEE